MPLDPIPEGEPFTLVHSADLHLGSGMRVAKRLGRMDDLKDATFEALDNLVSLVEATGADILTLGGDLFDEPNLRNPGPRLRLADALARIPDTRVAIVRGNHDHHHRDAPRLQWPDNVFEFEGTRKTCDLGRVRIHGVSYAQARETTSLLPRYPAPTGRFDIGLLHANVGGVAGHEDYAPCTVGDLQAHGYQMWLLGHIHKRQVLSEDPLILYPGNLQGRDIGETGTKTAEVIEVSGSGRISHRPEPVHSILWERMDVDVSGLEDVEGVIRRIERRLEEAQSAIRTRGLITRVCLTGTTEAHRELARVDGDGATTEEIQEYLNAHHGDQDPFLLIDKVEVRTAMPLDLERLRESDDITGLLVQMAGDDPTRRAILDELVEDGPVTATELEALAADLWDDALQGALMRLVGGERHAD